MIKNWKVKDKVICKNNAGTNLELNRIYVIERTTDIFVYLFDKETENFKYVVGGFYYNRFEHIQEQRIKKLNKINNNE